MDPWVWKGPQSHLLPSLSTGEVPSVILGRGPSSAIGVSSLRDGSLRSELRRYTGTILGPEKWYRPGRCDTPQYPGAAPGSWLCCLGPESLESAPLAQDLQTSGPCPTAHPHLGLHGPVNQHCPTFTQGGPPGRRCRLPWNCCDRMGAPGQVRRLWALTGGSGSPGPGSLGSTWAWPWAWALS